MEAISSTNYHNYNKKKTAGKIEKSEDAEAFLKELSAREAKEAKNLREFLRKVEKEQ